MCTCVCVCARVCVCAHTRQCVCGGERTAFRSWLSPSTIGFWGSNLSPQAWWEVIYPLSHLIGLQTRFSKQPLGKMNPTGLGPNLHRKEKQIWMHHEDGRRDGSSMHQAHGFLPSVKRVLSEHMVGKHITYAILSFPQEGRSCKCFTNVHKVVYSCDMHALLQPWKFHF